MHIVLQAGQVPWGHLNNVQKLSEPQWRAVSGGRSGPNKCRPPSVWSDGWRAKKVPSLILNSFWATLLHNCHLQIIWIWWTGFFFKEDKMVPLQIFTYILLVLVAFSKESPSLLSIEKLNTNNGTRVKAKLYLKLCLAQSFGWFIIGVVVG